MGALSNCLNAVTAQLKSVRYSCFWDRAARLFDGVLVLADSNGYSSMETVSVVLSPSTLYQADMQASVQFNTPGSNPFEDQVSGYGPTDLRADFPITQSSPSNDGVMTFTVVVKNASGSLLQSFSFSKAGVGTIVGTAVCPADLQDWF